MQELTSVAAVIVHHRSLDSVLATVRNILSGGIAPEGVVVVDNSEQPEVLSRLKDKLPAGVAILAEENSGYGAAVNQGVAYHLKNQTKAQYLLVSTHESMPETGAITALVSALDANPRAAVVGPALVTGPSSSVVWSLGGKFTRFLRLPAHIGHKTDRSQIGLANSSPVDWLDGAFLLFRKSVVEAHPIDERFFLYMEETDHHSQLRKLGWEVLIEPRAVVWQSSNGVPPYYLTRNIQLFQAKNGNKIQRYLSAPFLILRTIIRDVIKRERSKTWKPLLAGLRSGAAFKSEQSAHVRRVHIINPLGGALAHYTTAMESLLREAGASVRVSAITEPSVSGKGRIAWLWSYLLVLAAARPRGGPERVLVVWPVLGFFDLLLARGLCGRSTAIVYHDPKPLVRAVGTGRTVARLTAACGQRAAVIVHSSVAAEAMIEAGLGDGQTTLEHPMFAPSAVSSARLSDALSRPVVRVLGQYKPDRDLDVLSFLGSELKGSHRLEIIGRGWPAVPGWTVDARFVSETELDGLIHTSSVVVIPYRRFYQSGIAMRALELGTPIVGRADTSLSQIYGEASRLLVPSADDAQAQMRAWLLAVDYAVSGGAAEARLAAETKFAEVEAGWRKWLALSQLSAE